MVLAWFATMARPCLPHLTGGQAGDVTNRTFYVCWYHLSHILLLCLPWKILEQLFFTGSPVLADAPIQFFNGIWACTPFPHSGSVLCRCSYKERIVRQTTIAKTPSHQSVDDCCLALPPRLWQPRYPEGGEAIVIAGSLTFPHSCWVSQLDAVLRHTQDVINKNREKLIHVWFYTDPPYNDSFYCQKCCR